MDNLGLVLKDAKIIVAKCYVAALAAASSPVSGC
jgi:hypothetical protein